MVVSVFGGSQVSPGSTHYEEALALGRLIAEKGHTVATGGYMGMMEAVSRGAHEAGGHVIGVTCEDIENWRPIRANAWVKEEHRTVTLLERLRILTEKCDAAVALPGGPGTLAEIALTWNLMIIGSRRRKLVLVGEGWELVFRRMFAVQSDFVPEGQQAMLRFSPDVRSTLKLL